MPEAMNPPPAPTRPRLAPLALGLALAAAPAAPAVAAADEECLHAFSAAALAAGGKPRIRCTDNDAACDADPTLGVCQIPVGVCLNTSDPSGRCAPRELDFYAIENVQPDTEAGHDFEFQTLEDTVASMGVPVDADELDVCVGPVAQVLHLAVRVGKKGASFGKGKEKLHGTVRGPEGEEDEDTLPITCLPAKGTDACQGAVSTLDFLERRVFAPTCSRDTCHVGPQSDHTLSLLPGEAHLDLVGVQPDNVTARRAGKLRVDPGNPDNSFLLDKLRGTLDPDEGERMPRGLAKISGREIALVEAWIAAGAPATGFVDGPGCPGP
jgi:hypothetical protein